MTDPITPPEDPAAANEPALDPTLEKIEAEVTEAKKTFSLSDRLKGIKRRTEKVVLFLDLDAVRAYTDADSNVQMLSNILANEKDAKEKARKLAEFNEAEKALEPLRAAMFEQAIAFHLQAVPNVAVERAQRAARKAYELPDGVIPPESQAMLQDKYNILLLKDTIVKVATTDGDLNPSVAELEELKAAVDLAQWNRLLTAIQTLNFTEGAVRASLDDPGF